MFCPLCGNEIPDDSMFCPKCGNMLTPKNDDGEGNEGQNFRDIQESNEQSKSRKKQFIGSKTVLFILLLILVITQSFSAYFLYNVSGRNLELTREKNILEEQNKDLISENDVLTKEYLAMSELDEKKTENIKNLNERSVALGKKLKDKEPVIDDYNDLYSCLKYSSSSNGYITFYSNVYSVQVGKEITIMPKSRNSGIWWNVRDKDIVCIDWEDSGPIIVKGKKKGHTIMRFGTDPNILKNDFSVLIICYE